MSVGVMATYPPAFVIASILLLAEPRPRSTILDAWEKRWPSGAHAPETYTTKGLVNFPGGDDLGALLFLRTTYFGINRHAFGFGIFLEQRKQIRHRGAENRFRAGMDDRAHAEAAFAEHPRDGSRLAAAAREHADGPSFEEGIGPFHIAAEPADHGFSRRDDPDGAGPEQAGPLGLAVGDHLHDVVDGGAFHAGDHVLDARIRRLHDRGLEHMPGHEDDAEVDLAVFAGDFLHRVVDRNAVNVGALLAGAGAADDMGSVAFHVFRAHGPFTARNALNDHFRILVDQYAHTPILLVKDGCPTRREASGQSALGQIFRQPGDRDIDGDGLVAVEGTGEFTGKAFRAETEHFFRRQMLDRGHAVLQFKDAPRIFFTGGDARLGLAGEALADIDRDSRGFFFDFQGSTLPSETFSQRCIPCTEQAAVRR